MSDEEMKAELERLRSENAALKKAGSSSVRMKVSEKGALSIYGMGRFPVTLYKEQWLKLLGMADEIRAIGIDQDDENGSLGNHIADDGSNVTEAERLVTISEDFQQLLGQINEALERMDEGAYGTCLRCGKPIGEARLEAFPYVAYCIECQSIIEREQALRAGG